MMQFQRIFWLIVFVLGTVLGMPVVLNATDTCVDVTQAFEKNLTNANGTTIVPSTTEAASTEVNPSADIQHKRPTPRPT